MKHNSPPTSEPVDANTPSFHALPPHVVRKIAARWGEWEPWVKLYLYRCDFEPQALAVAMDRMRCRHREHLARLLRVGIQMRQVRRHRLDDPRISDEARAVLVRVAMGRQGKSLGL